MTVIRFEIGVAFPADDPVARFITGLAMISNDWLRSFGDLLRLGDTDEDEGRRVSLFRQQAALIHEAATFISDARRLFAEVAVFIDALDEMARTNCARVTDAVDRTSEHYLGEWLENHRNVTHHYPQLHPDKAAHGEEEMANALMNAAGVASSIDSGTKFGDARFRFADVVGEKLLPGVEDTTWVEQLRETAMALADFAQRAAQAYLESGPTGTFTVDRS